KVSGKSRAILPCDLGRANAECGPGRRASGAGQPVWPAWRRDDHGSRRLPPFVGLRQWVAAGRPDPPALARKFPHRSIATLNGLRLPDRAKDGYHTAHFCLVRSRRPSMSEFITNVSDASFEQDVLQADGPVLVDYWAEWCGPCKMIAPVLDEIAQTYQGKLKVCKLNIDDNQETPPKYGVRGIPTLMLFK